MNPVLYFVCLFLLMVCKLSGQAQVESSVFSMSWHDMRSSSALLNNRTVADIQIGQPMAVPNILFTRIEGAITVKKSRLSGSYSLASIPGTQEHRIRFGVGKWLKPWLFIQAGLEVGITMAGRQNQLACSWSAWNTILIRLNPEQLLRMELGGWNSLISNQIEKPDPVILLSYLYSFEDDCWLDMGLLTKAGSALRGFLCVGLRLNDQHSLFSGLMLNPSGFGIGYAYHRQGLTVRILLENSSVFGLSHASTFSWLR